jgi:hypothetical protein
LVRPTPLTPEGEAALSRAVTSKVDAAVRSEVAMPAVR